MVHAAGFECQSFFPPKRFSWHSLREDFLTTLDYFSDSGSEGILSRAKDQSVLGLRLRKAATDAWCSSVV